MLFELKALRDSPNVVLVAFEASDKTEAIQQAQLQGYTVLAAKPKHTWAYQPFFHSRKAFPLVLFSQELLVLLNAGLPLLESLDSLAEKERNARAKNVVVQICKHLREGQPFSSALLQFPATFPALYVATIRASEKTGDLPEALARFVGYQSKLDLVKNKIVSASIYPVLLFSVGGLVSLFLMFYVVPRFSRIYEDIGSNLPLFSRWLLTWGGFLEAHGTVVIITLAAFIATSVYFARLPRTRSWIEKQLWQLPSIGQRIQVYHLSRFYRTVGMLLKGGIPAVQALDMAAGLLHPALREPLTLASRSIREGRSISQSLESLGLTTPVALRMLVVGERSGTMGQMMENIAVFHDEEIARWVDWFTRLFEPILMALIGLVIGGIVILMYMPIFELAGSIK